MTRYSFAQVMSLKLTSPGTSFINPLPSIWIVALIRSVAYKGLVIAVSASSRSHCQDSSSTTVDCLCKWAVMPRPSKRQATARLARKLGRELLADSPEELLAPRQQLQLQARPSKKLPAKLGHGHLAIVPSAPVVPHGLRRWANSTVQAVRTYTPRRTLLPQVLTPKPSVPHVSDGPHYACITS